MFGSKNSELTRKYGLISLASSTFELEISSRPGRRLDEPDRREQQRQRDGDAEDLAQQPLVHGTSSSSRNSTANGT